MSAEIRKEIKLEIGHVLFMDIVGFSKLLINEQAETLRELNQIVRSTDQFRKAEAAEELIRLPTGDGMVLVFLRRPEALPQLLVVGADRGEDHAGGSIWTDREVIERCPSSSGSKRRPGPVSCAV